MKKALKLSLTVTATIIVLLLTVIVFAACGVNGQEAETPAPDKQDANASVEPTLAPTPELTPEPTDAPTPEPTSYPEPSDEELIETAWTYAETISSINEFICIKEGAEVERYHVDVNTPGSPLNNVRVIFPIGSGESSVPDYLAIMLKIRNRTELSLEYYYGFLKDPDYRIWSKEVDISSWERTVNKMQIVLTPEEIAASGCTATEGDEYLDAVGVCFQKKLVEAYLSFPEDSPIHFIEVRPLSCVRTEYLEGDYHLEYAVRVNDPFAVYLVFEGSLRWANSEMISEGLSGWFLLHGYTGIERQEDGSWIGGITLGQRG